jgi:hypothetical protein
MADGTYSIGLVVEAPADARATTTLVDRCLCEGIEWLDAEQLDFLRSWRGVEPGTDYTKWSTIKHLARKYRVDQPGYFDGAPGNHDAQAARRALLLFVRLGMPHVVVLVRDADDRVAERREGFEQARMDSPHPERTVVRIANPEREAWVIGGFVACDEREQDAVAAERQRLGFDPTLRPHELRGDGKRSAKKALASLIGDDPDREHRCLTEPPLSELRRRGEHTGLAAFLDEIDDRIVPVVDGRRAP